MSWLTVIALTDTTNDSNAGWFCDYNSAILEDVTRVDENEATVDM